ncbi:unnamed protein product [Spodoptera exigua]|nr:unnamed protein product [Spodoptera exigua]
MSMFIKVFHSTTVIPVLHSKFNTGFQLLGSSLLICETRKRDLSCKLSVRRMEGKPNTKYNVVILSIFVMINIIICMYAFMISLYVLKCIRIATGLVAAQ